MLSKLYPKYSNVGILFGGTSMEAEVSSLTAAAALSSLTKHEFSIHKIDISNDPLSIRDSDYIFNCMHGSLGEDGKIQGYLEVLNKPYTGSGVFSSALCRDKVYFKQFVSASCINTPKHISINESVEDSVFPVVLKPRKSGGSLGIIKCTNTNCLSKALAEIDSINDYFIEEFIDGTVITVGIIETSSEIIPSPVIEVKLPDGKKLYDYDSKINGKAKFRVLNNNISEKVRALAVDLHKMTGCSGFSRIDFILKDEEAYVLEINTIPSLFEGSSYRFAMEQVGIGFDKLCLMMLDTVHLPKT